MNQRQKPVEQKWKLASLKSLNYTRHPGNRTGSQGPSPTLTSHFNFSLIWCIKCLFIAFKRVFLPKMVTLSCQASLKVILNIFFNMFIGQNQGCPVWPILKPKLMGWCSGMGWGRVGGARGEPVFTNVQVLVFRQFCHWSPFFLLCFCCCCFSSGFSNFQSMWWQNNIPLKS